MTQEPNPAGPERAPRPGRPARPAASAPPDSSDGSSPDVAAALLDDLTAEVNAVPPLAPGERERLLEHVDDRDPGARDRLLAAHLPMVLRLAREFQGRGLSVADLFQEGSVGLLSAIEHYKVAGATDFDAYAEQVVRLSLEAALEAEAADIVQERALIEAAELYDGAEMKLAGELRRRPTVPEIGAALGWDLERAEFVAEVVAEARRQHDEELLQYLDPDADPDELDPADFVGGSRPEEN